VAGGGFAASILSYIGSDSFAAHVPAVLVWEVPGEYDLNRDLLYRQLVPAVAGVCATAPAKMQLAGRTKIFSSAAGEQISARDYLVLEPDNPAPGKFALGLSYAGGQTEQVELEHSTRTGASGKYFLEIGRTGLSEIWMEDGSYVSGAISVRLCRGG
jgi:hypothetical protein